MPWTLYGYILRELLKLLVVCTLVLVSVISFAAAIKPLSDGLLDPWGLIKFVLFVAPTFVGFILPFAGAFASTLVFHRMASENEIIACSASGLSYRAILLPVLFLGLVLTLSLFLLSNWVVPRFHLMASQQLQKDVTSVLVNQVREGRAMELGDMVVYADRADDSHPPPVNPHSQHQPYQMILLEGVAVGKLDKNHRIQMDVTAERANVHLYNINDHTYVTMRLRNVTFYEPMRGLVANENFDIRTIRVPSPLRDDPKFLSWPRLDELRERPERFDKIDNLKHTLIERLALLSVIDQLEAALLSTNATPVVLQGGQPGEEFVVAAPAVERQGDRLVLRRSDTRPVVVRKFVNGVPTQRIEARRAELVAEVLEPLAEPEVRIEMVEATIYDETLVGRGTQHNEYAVTRTRWPAQTLQPLTGFASTELIDMVYDHPELAAVENVMVACNRLQRGIVKLHREIEAQLHKRAAAATSCLFALLVGTLLSIRLKDRMPLVVYFWTFLLSVLVAIITYSGEKVATNSKLSANIGLFVTWSGAMLLFAVVAGLYAKVSRN